MKKYSNSKAKRLASQGKAPEVDEEAEIDTLRTRRVEEAPESGSQLQSNGELKFDMLPISSKTLKGLADANLTICTEIQAAALPHALSGRDILGAAKTGSGKTLSFVIPLIEKLYTERWSTDDGLAAIVITPTRELALQIFEVVRIVGKKHQFSAGLITGGKKEFEGEQERVIGMNILVSTPGRLLHHFEQTVGFDASQLMVLVLDEADRILDMGFKQQLDAIVEYLPTSRQTMLFSATQTKSVKDLARLSLKNAEYVAVRSEDNEVTPKQLIQNYIVCPLQDKLDVLFSFLKTHLKSKIIVFFSTCSQVRFVYECFRGMQPGIPLVALHGKIKQERRTIIYMDYIKKAAACLIATDIAARGLDFPNVDWVIQADAPEDAAMYIHRAGRTARYNAGGRAMLMLTPQEEQQVSRQLTEAGVPIQKLTVNPKKTFSVAAKAAALLAAQPEYRLYAKKAFTGYLRSIQLLPSNSQLDVNKLPLDEFAASLGLGFTPPVPVVERGAAGREDVREKKNVNRSLDKLKKQIAEAKEAKRLAREQAKLEGDSKGKKSSKMVQSDDDSEEEEELLKKKEKDKKKAAEKKKQKVLEESERDEDDGEEFLTVKQSSGSSSGKASEAAAVTDEQIVAKKPKKLKINMDGEQKGVKEAGAKKIAFDEDGNTVSGARITLESKAAAGKGSSADEVAARIAQHASEVKARIDRGRKEDAEREKLRIREKRLKAKRDADGDNEEDEEGAGECRLSSFVPEEESSGSGSGSASESESESSSSEEDNKGRGNKGVAAAAAGKKRKDLTSSSSSSSSSESESDSESDSATNRKEQQRPKRLQQKAQPAKRKRSDTDSDSGSDSDNSDVDAEAIKKQEEMVMQMMKRKK